MKTRTLTVSELTRPANNYQGFTMVPFIRLSGKWLQDAGFKAGDHIQVEVEQVRLVISKLGLPGNPVEFTFTKKQHDNKHTQIRKES